MRISNAIKSINIEDAINNFNTLIDTIDHAKWTIGCIVGAIIIISSLLDIRKRSMKFSKAQIDALIKNGKYIPGVFVELNNTKEFLRFFIFGKKWEKRLIEKYNLIYSNVYGEILKRGLLEEKITFKLPRNASLAEIDNAAKRALEAHNHFSRDKIKLKPEYNESRYLFEIIHMPYEVAFQDIIKPAEAAQSRYYVLTGSAGNGKTNMLCSITELLINLKQGVVFLNAREIDGNVADYMLRVLGVADFWIKHTRVYFSIVDKILTIKRKKLFIIIDAINENDAIDFGERIKHFISFCTHFHCIKIIVSCRNEYYEERFKKYLVDESSLQAFECDLKGEPYSPNAQSRIIARYKEFFNYTGNISQAVKNVLCEHLLLLRIFFETKRDSEEDVFSVRKHEIFRAYIAYLKTKGLKDIDVVLDVVTEYMLKEYDFDGVDRKKICTELMSRGISSENIEKLLDGNALVGKKIVILPNTVGQSVSEQIYFVFDELRDYCIAHQVVVNNSSNGKVNIDGVFRELDRIKQKKVSCEEGLIHYIYVFFRTYSEFSLQEKERCCGRLLDYYRIKSNDVSHSYFGRSHREEFMNLGLKIIFTTGLELDNFEKEYIRDCLDKNPYEDGGKIFDFMLEETINDGNLDINAYMDILFGMKNEQSFERALAQISSHGTFVTYQFPQDLIGLHKTIMVSDADKAYQIQLIAELFLVYWEIRDISIQRQFKGYFYALPTHIKAYDEVQNRLRLTYGE